MEFKKYLCFIVVIVILIWHGDIQEWRDFGFIVLYLCVKLTMGQLCLLVLVQLDINLSRKRESLLQKFSH